MKEIKLARHRYNWTDEELEYLAESWGIISLDAIARNLQRSNEAVRYRASKLGLGASRYAGGLAFTVYQVAKILGKCQKEMYRLVDKGVIKASRKKLVNVRVYQIHVDNLLEFLKNNPDKWDSRKVEEFTFGIEPDWMKEKRKKDLEVPKKYVKWTREEENRLISYVNAGCPMKEIADMLGRSTNSIYRRAQELRNRGKLKPTKIMLYWTDKEIDLMFELEKQGLNDQEIAYELGREAMHISDKRRMLRRQGYYEGNKSAI